jgi:hypothetical protein
MKMKSLLNITLFLAVMAFAGKMTAQSCPGGHGHGHGHAQHVEHMRTALGLSDDQVKKMEAIHEKYHPQIKELWADETLNNEARITQMKTIREAKHAEIQQILTPEQWAKVEAMHGQHSHHGNMGSGEGIHHGHGGGMQHGKHGHHAAFKQQLEPIIMAQRVKFETQLSAEDKTQIADLRSQMEVLRTQKKAMHKAIKQTKQEGQTPTDAQRAEMEQFHAQKHAIMEKAMVIAERYQPQIQALHDEVKPQIEAIIKEMQAQYGEQHGKSHGHCAQARSECKGKGGHGNFHGPHHPMGHHDMDHGRMLAHFILMDPNAPAQASKNAASAETAGDNLIVFPNPSSSSNTLRYSVQKAGQVRIELLNIEGKVLKVLRDGQQQAGSQSLEVNTSDLTPGTYMYRLIDAAGSRTQRFSVVK